MILIFVTCIVAMQKLAKLPLWAGQHFLQCHDFAYNRILCTGHTAICLYHASEALRLGSSLVTSLYAQTKPATSHSAQHSASDASQPHSSYSSQLNATAPPGTPVADADLAETEPHIQTDTSSFTNSSHGNSQDPMTGCRNPPQHLPAEGVGYWQVTWLYLTSLLKLGEVYEMAGSHEDALHAFKEGQELVCLHCPVPSAGSLCGASLYC